MKIILLVLSMIVGLWKAIFGRVARIRKIKKEAYNDVKDGIKTGKRGRILRSFTKLRRTK